MRRKFRRSLEPRLGDLRFEDPRLRTPQWRLADFFANTPGAQILRRRSPVHCDSRGRHPGKCHNQKCAVPRLRASLAGLRNAARWSGTKYTSARPSRTVLPALRSDMHRYTCGNCRIGRVAEIVGTGRRFQIESRQNGSQKKERAQSFIQKQRVLA